MAIGDHPARDLRSEWRALYGAAVDNLETLYQGIGSRMAEEKTSGIDETASGD